MAKRLIDTELWNNSDIIESFTAEDKYFWLYLLTSPHGNVCGCVKYNAVLMARDMGLHKDTIIQLVCRFKNYGLIEIDEDAAEILILNWYKFNWTRSDDFLKSVQRQTEIIKSEKLRNLVFDRLELFVNGEVNREIKPKKANTNYISADKVREYFEATWKIYPRKANKVQAQKTYLHKICGLEVELAHKTALMIYNAIGRQKDLWAKENGGNGREFDKIPHCSTWLNDNFEDTLRKRY